MEQTTMTDELKSLPRGSFPAVFYAPDGRSVTVEHPREVPEGFYASQREARAAGRSADSKPDVKDAGQLAREKSDAFWAPYDETRESAEAKAAELGIQRASTMKDETLAERIVDAIAEQKQAALDAEVDEEAQAEAADDADAE